MPRPRILRSIRELPKYSTFGPLDVRTDLDIVTMTIDEYETIKLIDYEGYNQAECADFMGIGRTTAQRIYNNARKKISFSIIEGRRIEICGGDYHLQGRGQGGNGHHYGRGRHGNGMGRR